MMMAGKRPKKKIRRSKPSRPSRKAEAAYRADLQNIVNMMRQVTEARLLPALKQYAPEFERKRAGDSLQMTDRWANDFVNIFDLMSKDLGQIDELSRRLAATAVNRQAAQTDQQLASGLSKSLGIGIDVANTIKGLNVGTEISAATAVNVDLIKSLPSQYLDKTRSLVLNGAAQGRRHEDLAEDIKKQLNVSETRAKLIARDQMAKVNASITEAKQQALGIIEYEWSTAGDERVRESHADNDGKIFRWDSPPAETGHPGDDVNCRCVAIPIINFDD